MPELTIKITSISQPVGTPGGNREPSFISVQVTGDGVTIEAGDIMISDEDADRLKTAIERWEAAQETLDWVTRKQGHFDIKHRFHP